MTTIHTPIGWFLPTGAGRILGPLIAVNRGDTLPTRAVSLTGDLITTIDDLPDDAIELIDGNTVRKLHDECIATHNRQAAIIQQVTRERDQALAGQPRRPTKHSSPATTTRDHQS